MCKYRPRSWVLVLGLMLAPYWVGARSVPIQSNTRTSPPKPLGVKVWIDAASPGSPLARPLKPDGSFQRNDEVVLRVQATQSAYVYVFTQTGDDGSALRLRKTSAGLSILKSGSTLRFPGGSDVYPLNQVTDDEHFKIVASRRPLDGAAAKSLGLPWPLLWADGEAPSQGMALASQSDAKKEKPGDDKKEGDKDKGEKKDSKCDENPGQKGRPPQCRRVPLFKRQPDSQYVLSVPALENGTALVKFRLRHPQLEGSAEATK